MKVLEAKTKETLIFDPIGYTGCLRACPFNGNVSRVALCEGFRLGAGWHLRLEGFWQMNDVESSSSGEGTSRSFSPYVLRSITVSLQPGWFEELVAMEAAWRNGCQGTPWSEELDDKELHGALGAECDLEPRKFAVSCTSSPRCRPAFLPPAIIVALCRFKRGGVLINPLYAPVAQRYHVTSDTLGREFDPGKRDFSH